MSLKSEVQNYATYLGNAWDKAEEKGATIPANKNLNNLATAIDGIQTGGSTEPLNGTIISATTESGTIEANKYVTLKPKNTAYYSGLDIKSGPSSNLISCAIDDDRCVTINYDMSNGYPSLVLENDHQTIGSPLLLDSYYYTNISICKIDSTHVAIYMAHQSKNLIKVVSISNNELSVVASLTPTLVETNSYITYNNSTIYCLSLRNSSYVAVQRIGWNNSTLSNLSSYTFQPESYTPNYANIFTYNNTVYAVIYVGNTNSYPYGYLYSLSTVQTFVKQLYFPTVLNVGRFRCNIDNNIISYIITKDGTNYIREYNIDTDTLSNPLTFYENSFSPDAIIKNNKFTYIFGQNSNHFQCIVFNNRNQFKINTTNLSEDYRRGGNIIKLNNKPLFIAAYGSTSDLLMQVKFDTTFIAENEEYFNGLTTSEVNTSSGNVSILS